MQILGQDSAQINMQVGLYGTVKLADRPYAYAGTSGEARAGKTLYGGSVGLRMAL